MNPQRAARAAAAGFKLLREGGLRAVIARLRERWSSRSAPLDYTEWIHRHDRLDPVELELVRARLAARHGRPLFSALVLPGGAAEVREQTRAAVRAQLWPDWELIEVHSGLPAALGVARGSFVALLAPGDLLAAHAFALAGEALRSGAGADLIYWDEDRLDAAGARTDPFFKPGFDPELLWSIDYLTGASLVRADLAREVAAEDPLQPGAEHYHLLLRCAARAGPDRITHLPHVLTHQLAERAQAGPAECAALQSHLAQATPDGPRAPGALVEPGRFAGTRRVKLAMPAEPPLVSLIIPTRDGVPVLRRCIESLRAQAGWPRTELIVVDNGSEQPETLEYLDELAREGARVLREEGPFNFSALNNRAARAARGRLLALLNNDLEAISPGWLTELATHALRPEIGAVGARLLYPDGRVQHAGVASGVLGVAGHILRGLPRDAPGPRALAHVLRGSTIVTGACLLVRRALYLEVGGLDERELRVAFNDVDFCLRLAARGYRNLYTPWAELLHHESWSRGSDQVPGQKARFDAEIATMRRRWPRLAEDPLYNPNLSLDSEQMLPASPPRARRPWLREGESP